MMKQLLGCLLICCSVAAQARDPERGKKVLAEAIRALGGDAYLNAREFRSVGRAYQFDRYEELAGMARVVNYEKQPDKFRQEMGKRGDVVFVFNGERGWEQTFRGVKEMLPAEVERIRIGRELSLDSLLRFRLKEPGLEVTHTGTDIIDGRTVDLVEIVDSQNRMVNLTIDRNSHLPVRREWVRFNERTREREENVETLGKYVRARGLSIMMPTYIRRERNGIKLFEAFFTEVYAGGHLADSLFERPSGKELKDPRRR
jgi:hypothetical protein